MDNKGKNWVRPIDKMPVMKNMDGHNKLNGKLSLSELQEIVSNAAEVPVALQRIGKWDILCPYCGKIHQHGPGAGHRHSHCLPVTYKDYKRQKKIIINGKEYDYHYGYHIIQLDLRGIVKEARQVKRRCLSSK